MVLATHRRFLVEGQAGQGPAHVDDVAPRLQEGRLPPPRSES